MLLTQHEYPLCLTWWLSQLWLLSDGCILLEYYGPLNVTILIRQIEPLFSGNLQILQSIRLGTHVHFVIFFVHC